MGILDPFSCGFVKIAVYNILCKNIPKCQGESKTAYTQRLLNKKFSMNNNFFATKIDASFKLKNKTCVNNFTKTKDNINILNKRIQAKRRTSRPDVFCKKVVLRNFAKFIGKHLC